MKNKKIQEIMSTIDFRAFRIDNNDTQENIIRNCYVSLKTVSDFERHKSFNQELFWYYYFYFILNSDDQEAIDKCEQIAEMITKPVRG